MELISFVIPVYNGEKSVEELYLRIVKTCEGLKKVPEIIFIDDLSKDNSREKLKELEKNYPYINIIFNTVNLGQQRTVLKGLRVAKGDVIVTLDDDLEHAPEEVGKLLSKLEENLDLVYGITNRNELDRSFTRRIGSVLRNVLFKNIFGHKQSSKLSSFRIFSRKLVNKLTDSDINAPFIYISAIFMKKEAKTDWIYVNGSQRKYGKSNYTLIKLIILYTNIIIYYSENIVILYLKIIFKGVKSKDVINDTRSRKITN